MNFSIMFNMVFDAINNGMQLAVADDWKQMFHKVCRDYSIDYVAECKDGFMLVTFER